MFPIFGRIRVIGRWNRIAIANWTLGAVYSYFASTTICRHLLRCLFGLGLGTIMASDTVGILSLSTPIT